MRQLDDLIHGATVACEALDRDPFGRIISRCSVDGREIGTELVRAGLAWALREYSDDYIEIEDVARDAAIGIWQHPAQPPWEYRDDKWARAVAASPDGCPIKGNMNSSGERIYHKPRSPNYWQTIIELDEDPEKSERWFCNEGNAMGEGWRPVR